MAEYQLKDSSNINGVTLNITLPDGKVISPSYEAHSLERVNEIITSTRALITEGTSIEAVIY